MRISFYIARNGGMFDAMIAAYGQPKRYSHVELVFSDGWSFSSSLRDGGPRFTLIDYGTDHWDFIEIPMSEAQEKIVREWCKTKVPGHYDLFGVLAFKFPWIKQLAGAWFCSEICIAALQQVGMFTRLKPSGNTPNDFYTAALKLP